MSASLATVASNVADLAAALPAAGTFARAAWTTTVAPRGGSRGPFAGTVLSKETGGVVRFGVEYRNLQANADTVCPCGHVFAGTDTGALPWGQWMDYPRVIGHNGTLYVRLYALEGSLRTVYRVDGVIVDRNTFNGYLSPSAAKPRPTVALDPCPSCGRKRTGAITLTIKAASLTVG